jgi:uncharacterized membrane protein
MSAPCWRASLPFLYPDLVNSIRTDPLYLLTVLSLIVIGSEWLARRGVFRHLGSALLVIVIGALLANTGFIPAGSTAQAPVPVYDAVFNDLAPITIFWLLLPVSLRDVFKVGWPLLAVFLIGSCGTMLGVVVGMRLVHGASTIGPLYRAVGGMFAGTYIGGSINFNAVALQYDVVRHGTVYGGSIVVDNIITTIWIVTTLTLPRMLVSVWPRRARAGVPAAAATPIVELEAESETLDPRGLALMLALGAGGLLVSNLLTEALARIGVNVPSILVITALALVLAQVPAIGKLPGARVLGMYAVYVFLTVIGAFCDVHSLTNLGVLGLVLLAFAMTTVLVHGAISFAAAWLLRVDIEAAAVASQANVGGGTSALALAKSLGREDLLVPGILLGSLGNAIGTFLGILVMQLT